MYACQHYGANKLADIAEAFALNHYGSASFSINNIKQEIVTGSWQKELKRLEKALMW